MRLLHCADLHLGFRTYDRMAPGGVNQRELDVERSFAHVIDRAIALEPELMVVGGDIFHHPKPPNRAIVHAYEGLGRLRRALPSIEIVMVAGNHDAGRTAETASILRLFRSLGVHVVDGAARVVDLPALDACVLGVPDNFHARPDLRPISSRRWKVLLLHGETGGISPAGSPALEREIPADEMHADAWDYIALGHYHVYREIAPNCFYSGSIDYSSSNVWGELEEERSRGLAGKGIVEHDLATGSHIFHRLPRTREFVDLPAISAHELPIADVNAAIEMAIAGCQGGIGGKVVRLTLTDIDHPTSRLLDHKLLRHARLKALHFQLVQKRPERVRVGVSSAVIEAVYRRAPLDELIVEMLRNRALPGDLSREEFVALGTEYFAQATEKEKLTPRVIEGPPSDAAVALARSMASMPSPYDTGEEDAQQGLPLEVREQLQHVA